MSHPGWLMTGSLCHGLLQSLYNWVGFHPLYNQTNRGLFFIAQLGVPPDHSVPMVWFSIRMGFFDP